MAKKNGNKRVAASKSKAKATTKTAKITKKPTKKAPAKKATVKSRVTSTRKSTPKPAIVNSAPLTTAKAPKPPKAPKAPKPAGQSSGPKGYTADQYKKYKQQKQRLINCGNDELKQMLKKNLQSMSGNKSQLVQKIADGIVLGRIPRCPNCFGGRPKYDYKKGTYNCPGYRDDEDFKNCHSTFTKEDLKRDPWEA